MSLKTALARAVRSSAPKPLVHLLEESYRNSRAVIVSAAYGFPAKSLKVIAVTGTNGKTTTVNFLNEILKANGRKTAMFSTATIEVDGRRISNDLNATVGTTSRMQKFFKDSKQAGVDYVIMEFPSHALHQHKLAGVPVEVAVMTNLTQDHLDYHKTMEEYAVVKSRLFQKKPPYIVLNCDDEWFDYFSKYPAGHKTLTYGRNEEADVCILDTDQHADGTTADISVDGETERYEVALPGLFNVYNSAAAIAVASLLGIDKDDIKQGIGELKGIPGRFERVENDKGIDIVVDYAHTPDGLEKLLEAAKSFTKGRVFLVFGSCGDRDRGKRPIMGEIAAKLADRIIVTDEENYTENASVIREQVLEGVLKSKRGKKISSEIADRKKAIEKALSEAKKGDTILVTGLGHEVFRIIDGEKMPWNDAEVVKSILEADQ